MQEYDHQDATTTGVTTARSVTGRTEDFYQQLVEMAPDAFVVVDASEKIELVNAQTERLFGYGRVELEGQPLDLLVPERFRAAHGAHVADFVAHSGTRSMGSGLELFGRRKDGSELPIEVSLGPLHTNRGLWVSAVIRDVSERKRLEARAKLGGERLASAVESIPDAFALFDDEDRLVLCNSVYRRLIGEALEGPVVGEKYDRLLDAWIGDIAFASESERTRYRSERLAGPAHDVAATFDLHMRDGRSLRVIDRRTAEGGTVKTIWDRTDDVHIAEQLRESRAAAESASSAKSDFLASMSHELRTPMNAVLGFAQLLQRDVKEPLSDRQRKRVAHILKGGEHLLRLIDDILDLSRIEAGGVTISIEPVDLLDLLREVRSTLEPLAAVHGIAMETPVSTGQPSMVAADRTRLAQILINFGSNAIKYNRPNGKVTFAFSSPTPMFARVTVRDTGSGIPIEQQGKLFQPFQRAGQETGPIQGTGIGLVVTKQLVELMRGSLGFRSVPGAGSEFWVDVPVYESRSREPR